MPSLEYENLELIRKNPSRDGEAYRGIIEGQDTLVKVVGDPEEREWLRHEATILARLEGSRHVPALYDLQEDEGEGKTYLAEEFVEGTSLEKILGTELNERKRITPLPPIDAAGLVNRIGAAEMDLLSRGVMYRDLQPTHVVFAEDDRRAVLVDLGLASADSYIDEHGTRRWRQTTPNGIYSTMSPAELRGEDMSEADVVYRLAVIYHTAITGEFPFSHPKRAEIETWVENPTFNLSDKLTPDGKELFENALYGDPRRQIKSVELFLRHLNRLKHKTVTASASPTPA